jgi:predicted RNase H-like HicB family nuclease
MTPTYNVAIYADPDVGGYWAQCTSLGGCFTQGETIKETELNMFEAVDLFLDDGSGSEIPDYFLAFEVSNA